MSAPLPLPETSAYLEQPGMTGGQEPLHTKLGGCLEKKGAGNFRFDPHLRGHDRQTNRSFDLEVIPFLKKNTGRPDDGAPLSEIPVGDHLSLWFT